MTDYFPYESVSNSEHTIIPTEQLPSDEPLGVLEPVAYPDEAMNQTDPHDPAADAGALVSVQSVVVDPADRLWILDTGTQMFQPTKYGGPKLVCVDLSTDEVVRKILFPTDVALPTTYLNDVRFDLRRASGGVAFITDSADKGPNG